MTVVSIILICLGAGFLCWGRYYKNDVVWYYVGMTFLGAGIGVLI